MGFTAFSLRPRDEHGRRRALVELVEAVRSAIGPEHELAVDCGGQLSSASARQLLPLLEPSRLAMLNEPVRARAAARAGGPRGASGVPLSVGRRLYSRWDLRPVLATGLCGHRPRCRGRGRDFRDAPAGRARRDASDGGIARVESRAAGSRGVAPGGLRDGERPRPGPERGRCRRRRRLRVESVRSGRGRALQPTRRPGPRSCDRRGGRDQGGEPGGRHDRGRRCRRRRWRGAWRVVRLSPEPAGSRRPSPGTGRYCPGHEHLRSRFHSAVGRGMGRPVGRRGACLRALRDGVLHRAERDRQQLRVPLQRHDVHCDHCAGLGRVPLAVGELRSGPRLPWCWVPARSSR